MNFTKERFLKYYRWLGPVYLSFGENTRQRNKVLRRRNLFRKRNNTSWSNITDKEVYLCREAAHAIIWNFKEYGDDYERAWKAWQREWPKALARETRTVEEAEARKALEVLVSRPPMTFKRVLFEIDRAIELNRARAS
jgi:hypothetical protein